MALYAHDRSANNNTTVTLARERLVRHGRVGGTAECKMCETGEIEDREHRMWKCSALEKKRGELGGKMRPLFGGMSPCEKLCGIVLKDSSWAGIAGDIHKMMLKVEMRARGLEDARIDKEAAEARRVGG